MPIPSTKDKGGLKSTAAATKVPPPVLPLELPPVFAVVLGSAATLDDGKLRGVLVELNPTGFAADVLKVAVFVNVAPKVDWDVVR